VRVGGSPSRKKNSIYFVELFPEDGLSGGSGVCVSPPERSLWLPPTDVSLLTGAFLLADLLFADLPSSVPEDRLFGESGVWVSPPERSLWLPPTEVSLLACAFPLGLLGLFPVLLTSLFPEEGLFGGSGV
jgi:hypothetical protein